MTKRKYDVVIEHNAKHRFFYVWTDLEPSVLEQVDGVEYVSQSHSLPYMVFYDPRYVDDIENAIRLALGIDIPDAFDDLEL